jgi:AcrR family transcriptional regulator
MSDTVKPASASRPRGRPRNEQTRRAILRAARDLLQQGGPGAVTMEGVAALAGVGKPTVYRWWPDRHAVTMAALMDAAPTPDETSDTSRRRPALRGLNDLMLRVGETFSGRVGRNVATMIAAADNQTEWSKAFRNHFVLARREEGRTLLQAAVEQGELRDDIDLDVTLDLLFGPLFFRLLLGHAPLDEGFVQRLFKDCLRGLRPETST